jgi:CheY-like chemotaxis protein
MPARPLSVLVVDPYPDAGESLATVLGLCGHTARAVRTAAEAERAAEVHRPDAVLTEVRLPDGDGYELAGRLRAVLAGALFAVVTAAPHQEGRSLVAGIPHHFVKPADPQSLVGMLERFASGVGVGSGDGGRAERDGENDAF